MGKQTVHISDAEAANNFSKVLARVRSGVEIVIDQDAQAVAIISPVETHLRLLSESLRLAKNHGSAITLDEAFSRDLEETVKSYREATYPPTWD